jgi:peptide/nickel transport system permease protein
MADNPLTRMMRGEEGEEKEEESPFREVLRERGEEVEVSPGRYRAERIRSWLQATVTNVPFVVGVVLVGVLLVVFLWGPKIAPHSPYTTQGLVYEDGELSVPPFEPSDDHPWGTDVLGRDVMSLVLAGAQQTLLLAALVVGARVVVGFVLGAIAGWWSGSWVDRFLMGLSETLAAFPTLLLAMTFILALGIREGFRPFVIALCLVGWGEVMQFVRGEVMSIRPKLYIEGAVAVGLTTPRIIISHVLPNLLSSLISITSLEMGAVLMLLGELGFVGIFIGGGAFAELETFAAPYHYSDVPEWGALLSNVRRYARSYSWMAVYPSLAFFVAILGFNLLGEGVRRLVESIGVVINRLVNRYTIAAAILAVVGIGWIQANTGATAFYQQQARTFDGGRAYDHAKALAHPMFEGRALGTEGMDAAAYHIAQQFEALGLQAAGEEMTYYQERTRSFEVLDAVPELVLDDGGPLLSYHQDYVEYVSSARNLGQGEGQIRFVALGPVTRSGAMISSYKKLEELDYSGEVLLAFEGDADLLRRVPNEGILVVSEGDQAFDRRRTLSSRDPYYLMFGTGEARGQDIPRLWVSRSATERLLQGTGYSVDQLRSTHDDLDVNEVFEVSTDVDASMEVRGTVRKRLPVRHVIANWTGASDSRYGGLNDQMIVVMAKYDTPPRTPDDSYYAGANDNASGVAVMLEAVRAMKESGYQPYRTFLFVAYGGEGQEGGEWVYPPDTERFLEAKKGFADNFDIEAVVDLRGVGAGERKGLIISAGGSMRLADLLQESAKQMGVRAARGGEQVDISIVFEERSRQARGQEAPKVGIHWSGWEATSCQPEDTVANLSEEKLERAGRVVSLALMTLGRERQY